VSTKLMYFIFKVMIVIAFVMAVIAFFNFIAQGGLKMELIIGVAAGLIIGWWFLPQPQFMRDLYLKLFPGGDQEH
jgi:hypothetical protein